MRQTAWIGFTIVSMACLLMPIHAQTPNESLKIYAVNVVKKPPLEKKVIGDGIYLGSGLIITAAHVVGRWPYFTHPHILIAGEDLPAKVIKEGAFPKMDLALLSVNEDRLPVSLRLRRNPLCTQPPRAGMRVIDVSPQALASAKVISPLLIAPALQARFSTLIDAPEGSGSGLFDAQQKCLVGIISAQVQQFSYQTEKGNVVWKASGFAGYFIPASKIATFIPSDQHY